MRRRVLIIICILLGAALGVIFAGFNLYPSIAVWLAPDKKPTPSATMSETAKETTTGLKRPCWNSWIAPHNFEGFFLNMGDMLVKQGDPAIARRIYANAKLSKTYEAWALKTVLEDRITQAEKNVALFSRPKPGEKTRTMMISSTFACAPAVPSSDFILEVFEDGLALRFFEKPASIHPSYRFYQGAHSDSDDAECFWHIYRDWRRYVEADPLIGRALVLTEAALRGCISGV